MARGDESVSDLYIRLGLSYDELESGFVNAERTIRDNMTRLSRENQIIDLQARVEIAGLDETADAEQILQIRTRALNQQLEHQRDRVRLASAELENMRDRTGENSDQTQRARLALERERLALANLEGQLADLNDTQEDTSESTDDLRTRINELADRLAPVAAGFTAVIGAIVATGEATKALIENWRELQKQSYELNLSIDDTRQLLRQIRLAGGDIGDFEGYIRGITDAYVKGEKDDPEFIALGKYGARITDATGKLKNFKAITEEVYQAYLKAKAAGEEIEFLQMTGGESGVRDAIQLFERYAEAKEDAAKIVDAGLNQNQLHQTERSLNLLVEQLNEFKDAAVNVITPATVKTINDLFGIFNAGTKIVKENTDTLRKWGSAFGEVASFMPGIHEFGWAWDSAKLLAGVGNEAEKTAENIKKANVKTQEGAASWADYRKATEGATKSWADFRRETDPKRGEDPLNQYGRQRLRDLKNEIEDIRIEIKYFNNDYKQSLAELELEKNRALDNPNYLSLKEELAIRERYTAQLELLEKKRAEAIKEAREDVEAELGTDLDRQLLDFQRQKKDWISAGMDAAEAEILTEKLKVDAIEELEEEFSDKLNDLRQSDLEKQLARFDKEKDALIDKGIAEERAEEYAAEARGKFLDEYREGLEKEAKGAAENLYSAGEQIEQLEKARAQAIEQFNDEVSSNVDSIWRTSLENRLAQIEQEKRAWIAKGVSEVKATKWAEQAKAEAQRNAAMTVLKTQLEEYRTFQKDGYEGLRNYQLQQLYKSGIRPEELEMTPGQLRSFQRAQMISMNSLMPNMMTAIDKSLAEQAKWNLPNERFANLTPPILNMDNIGNLNAIVGDIDKQTRKAVESYADAAKAVEEVTAKFKELRAVMDADDEKPVPEFSAVEQPTPTVEVPRVDIPTPETPEVDTSAMTQPVADITEKFVTMSPALEDLTGKITDLGTVIGEATENISPVDTAVETPDLTLDTTQIFAAFEELVSPMSEVNAQFGEMAGRLNEVTSGLSALVGALNNLQTQPQAQQQPQVVTPPPNINVTVQIEEAHAWDSQHIQELADRVADAIEPELVNAIGGDSNRY